jgi:hypothetical protein
MVISRILSKGWCISKRLLENEIERKIGGMMMGF